MQTQDQIGALVAAVAAATGEVGTVAKSGRNAHDRYTYSSDEDFARAVQPVMARHGLALVPVEMRSEWYDAETAKGRAMRGVVLTVHWLLMHSSGGTQPVVTMGEGIDRADKALAKAQTYARKYALRLVFQTPTSDDAERESLQPERYSRSQQAAPDARSRIRAKLVEAARAGQLTNDQGATLMQQVDQLTEADRESIAQQLQNVAADSVHAALTGMMAGNDAD